jgi:hypothetical protein
MEEMFNIHFFIIQMLSEPNVENNTRNHVQ